MKYKYQKGDLVRLNSPRNHILSNILEVISYNPCHPNPDKVLCLSRGDVVFSRDPKNGEEGMEEFKMRLPPIYCNPQHVVPVNPHQPLETSQIVYCHKNSSTAKIAKQLGDYVKTPLYKPETQVFFHHKGHLLKGVILAPQIDSEGIFYSVRVNGHRKIEKVSEPNLKPIGEGLEEVL